MKSIIDTLKEDGSLTSVKSVIKMLVDYADVIGPWAASVGRLMLADVNRRNEKAWREQGDEIGRNLRKLIEDTPTGAVFKQHLADQVQLITSIPRKAAIKAQKLVQEHMPRGTRSTTLAEEILKTSDIPKWRAKLIARTEVSKAAVALTQVRAQALGSQGYIWQTVGDEDVRLDHKRLQGKFIRWDDPPSMPHEPTLGPYHAGAGPNCRCWPRPVLPEF